MTDIIVVVILLLAVGGALLYIYKSRKKGKKCIGCPYSGECGKKNCSGSENDNIK